MGAFAQTLRVTALPADPKRFAGLAPIERMSRRSWAHRLTIGVLEPRPAIRVPPDAAPQLSPRCPAVFSGTLRAAATTIVCRFSLRTLNDANQRNPIFQKRRYGLFLFDSTARPLMTTPRLSGKPRISRAVLVTPERPPPPLAGTVYSDTIMRRLVHRA